ncbi:DNA N-6-adenine-methyltransferase [Paludisphaera sp. Pla2]|uniref:DNA N-6-adenine-methyltransferase n=2 Tax=Paludisphaera mucosa TaxID=3030827 RepID=A0ABT6FLR3_9BACT|nr:DNA N-6-adenine-methyltransferase [Paludisphaera mucosa]MDG3008459.1 DNA N-6-adenine-methyltransferase [Paludisphaera mucosa]
MAEVIRTLRTRRGLSQRELARVAGVSQPTVGTLERGGMGRLAPLERVLVALGAGAHLTPEGRTKSFYTTTGNSSIGQAWETPSQLLEVLYSVFGRFDLDPCSPSKKGPVKARVRFTAEDDGLELPWKGRVFVNPPYGRGLGEWVCKARSEFESGDAGLVVLLIPARTETSYWHRHVAGKASVWFIEGRLKFGGGKQSAPFPSALVVFGATSEEKERLDRSAVGWRAT